MNIEPLFEIILPFAETSLNGYMNQNAKKLKEFTGSFPELKITDNKNISLADIIEYYQSIKSWIKNNEIEKFLAPISFQEFENELQQLVSEYPDKIDLPYLPQEQLPQINGHKIVKNLRRFVYDYKYKRYTKRILKNSKDPKGRKLNLADFVKYYLLIPLLNKIYTNNKDFLHQLALIKHKIHESAEKMKNDILLVQNIDNNEQYGSNFNEQDLEKIISLFSQEISNIKSLNSNYKKNSAEETKKLLDLLQKNISDAWIIANSPLLPKRFFSLSVINKSIKSIQNKHNKEDGKWENHFKGDNEEWLKDIELSNLQLLTVQLHIETQNIIENKTQTTILPIFEDIKIKVAETIDIFSKLQDNSEEELRNTILIENRNLIKTLRQQKLPALTDAIIQANYTQAVSGYFRRIQSFSKDLSDTHSVFTKKDIINIPPQSDIVDIPLKELVENEILENAFKSRDKLIESIDKSIKDILLKIAHLDQIVEFNLEAAYDMLKENDQKDVLEQAQNIAIDGLERTHSNIEELKIDLLETISESSKYFGEITQKLEVDIQILGDNEKNLDLKIRLARAKTKEKLILFRKIIWQKTILLIPEIFRITKNFISKLRKEYFRIRKVTGLGPQISTSEEVLTQFLIDTQRKIKKMPYIYQRLFRLDPLEEKRFFYGRNKQMESLREDIEFFKDGNQAATAIVGEKGNGKTTILKFAEKEYFESFSVVKIDLTTTVYEEKKLISILSKAFNLSSTNSFTDFENILLSNSQKQICVIENLQNLFLRIINGFDSLEKLLLLISKTRHQIFWIVSCGVYAWEFLDRVIHISDYFKRTIFLEPLTSEEIKNVILNRHHVSGYGLSFLASEKVIKSRPYKKLKNSDEQQKYLENLLFNDLAGISGGNIKSAILFWLSVLQEFDEEKIIIGDKITLDHSHIYQLQPSDLFSLAAFVEHEYLTEEQHALIFNQNLGVSELIINRLYKRGYLEKFGEKYAVYPLLYRSVIKALKSKNILL